MSFSWPSRRVAAMRKVVPSWPSLVLVVCASGSVGCDWIPVRRRLDPSLYPVSAQRSVVPAPHQEGTATPMAAGDLPPLPNLIPVSDEEALRSPSPTPLLDEALARAHHIRQATLKDPDPPEVVASRIQLPDTAPLPGAQASNKAVPSEPSAEATVEPMPLKDEGLVLTSVEEPAPIEPPAVADPPGPGDGLPPPLPASPLETEKVDSQSPVEVRPGSLWENIMAVLDAHAEPLNGETDGQAGQEDPPAFRLLELKLCKKVNGLGAVEELDATACRPGQTVIVYCEMEGLTYRPNGKDYQSEMETSLELIRVEDGQEVWSYSKATSEQCPKPRRDYYVNYVFRLPEDLKPGRYTLRVRQAEPSAGVHADGELALIVRR